MNKIMIVFATVMMSFGFVSKANADVHVSVNVGHSRNYTYCSEPVIYYSRAPIIYCHQPYICSPRIVYYSRNCYTTPRIHRAIRIR